MEEGVLFLVVIIHAFYPPIGWRLIMTTTITTNVIAQLSCGTM